MIDTKVIIALSQAGIQLAISQQVVLEISDEIYKDWQRSASAAGLSVVEWATAKLNEQYGALRKVELSEAQKEAAQQGFRRHAGAIEGGCGSSDNESIDADLARAYANEY